MDIRTGLDAGIAFVSGTALAGISLVSGIGIGTIIGRSMRRMAALRILRLILPPLVLPLLVGQLLVVGRLFGQRLLLMALPLLLALPLSVQANTAKTAISREAGTLAVYYHKARIALDEFDPPASALLVASGVLGLMVVRRRQRRDAS